MKVILILFSLLSFGFLNAQTPATVESSSNVDPKIIEIEIVRLTEKINQNSNDGKLYHNRGMLFFVLKEMEKSIADFTRSIELKSEKLPESYFWRGWAKQNNIGKTYIISACQDFSEAKKSGYDDPHANWEIIGQICNF